MTDWKRYTLGECCEIISGATPSTSVDAYWEGDVCWATPKDLSDLDGHFISDTPRKLTEAGLASCAAAVLPPNSVLFSSRAPIGHTAINTVPMATNQGFKSFIPRAELLDSKFLLHWLRKNRSYLEGLGVGATFKEVSKAIVSKVEISLPGLAEQRRIAAILDKADALSTKRQEAMAQLDCLAQSIFVEMFGDPMTNPQSWPIQPLGELASKITDGEHLNPEFSPSGMPMVMAGNVLEDRIDLQGTKKVLVASGEKFRKKCNPEVGDLLVVSRGATIGRMCPVSTPSVFCLMGSVILIKLDVSVLATDYVTGLLKHPVMRGRLYKASGSSAQQAIYLKDVKNLPCMVPPIELQREFVERASFIKRIANTHHKFLRDIDDLLSSLRHRAFRGEL